MYRSFSDRVFAGLCGGLGALLPFNPWVWRVVFVVLTLVTGGLFAALYLLLWWIIPQEDLTGRRRGNPGLLLLTLILIALTLAAWWLDWTGQLVSPSGAPILWPAALMALAVVFFFRQVRG